MSATLTHFQIVRSASPGPVDLEKRVNAMLAEGYEPSGSPYRNDGTGEWCQAMIKRTPVQENGEVRLKEPKRK